MEYSKLGLEHFTPDYTHYFHALPERVRDRLVTTQWQLHKGIDADTIAAIHDELYRRTLHGGWPDAVLTPGVRVRTAGRIATTKVELHLEHTQQNTRSRLTTDAVVLATGYRERPLDRILAGLDPYIRRDSRERPRIDEQFRLVLDPSVTGTALRPEPRTPHPRRRHPRPRPRRLAQRHHPQLPHRQRRPTRCPPAPPSPPSASNSAPTSRPPDRPPPSHPSSKDADHTADSSNGADAEAPTPFTLTTDHRPRTPAYRPASTSSPPTRSPPDPAHPSPSPTPRSASGSPSTPPTPPSPTPHAGTPPTIGPVVVHRQHELLRVIQHGTARTTGS